MRDCQPAHLHQLRRDLQSVATSQAQATGQITTLATTVTQRLDAVSKSLTDGVVQSADISAKGQSAMREELTSGNKELGEKGFAALLNRPGLGIEVNEKALETYSEEKI